jgi:hypothetical protein
MFFHSGWYLVERIHQQNLQLPNSAISLPNGSWNIITLYAIKYILFSTDDLLGKIVAFKLTLNVFSIRIFCKDVHVDYEVRDYALTDPNRVNGFITF